MMEWLGGFVCCGVPILLLVGGIFGAVKLGLYMMDRNSGRKKLPGQAGEDKKSMPSQVDEPQ
jgi:hypothetical protein